MDNTKKQIERGGAEARSIFIRSGVALVVCCLMVGVQDGKKAAVANTRGATAALQNHMTPDETKVEVVPITEEHHHHLVLDNEYVRVFHVEVAPHAETRYHQHNMDYVFVTLGDSQVESVRVGEKPVKLELKDGDTRFTKGGFAHKAVNLSDKPFVNVTVELKRNKGDAKQNIGLVCAGFSCSQRLFETDNMKCDLISTTGSGTGVSIEASKHLTVAINDMYVDNEPVKSGETRWITEPFHLKDIHHPLRAVLCEFADQKK